MVTLWGLWFPSLPQWASGGDQSEKVHCCILRHGGEATKLVFFFFNAQGLSPVQLLVTPWTVAYQAPLSMEFPSFFFFF